MSFRFPRRRTSRGRQFSPSASPPACTPTPRRTPCPTRRQGAGSGTISGYTVTNVAYTLNTTTPTNLDQVAFTIAPTTTSTLKVQLAAAGSWYTCANAAGSVTCNTTSPQATAAAATQLTVVAAQ